MIWFVNRYFHPDNSATSQLLTELATELSRHHPVSVVTSRQLSGDASEKLKPTETVDGVNVNRLWTTRLGRSSLWRRAVDYLSFYGAVVLHLLRHVSRDDIVVLKTDPPLLQLINTSVIRLKRGKVINWLQDLYPEIAVRLGKFPGPAWLARGVSHWRDRALRAASANVVVSAAMARYLQGRGVGNTEVIPNWADADAIRPIAHEDNPLRTEWGLDGKFTVMYSGNFGRAHTFSEIADAVQQCASQPNIRFVFVGEGAGLAEFKSRLVRGKSGNFAFMPFQAKSALPYSLGAADLHLVTLREGMEDLLMPSKVCGILAAGRPMGFVGEAGSDLAKLIRKENLGLAVALGDAGALVGGILRLRDNPVLQALLQVDARRVFQALYTRAMAVESWNGLLERAMRGEENRSTADLRR